MFARISPPAGFSALALLALGLTAAPSAALPPNFIDQIYVGNFSQAVGLTFAPDGRLFVWEKRGRVFNVENGVRAAQPLIDIRQEVGNWRDYGLLGFALDPNFYTNGYIYLLYVVDYHHLTTFGTPDYDPAANVYFHDTIARLTRYTCNAGDGFRSVNYASRAVLIGESIGAGFPICHQSHGIGALAFGEDGTLLISCGDGASYLTVDTGTPTDGSSNTCLADGIITAKEDVGAFRAQLVDGLNGKILRVDPATGNGVAGNPYFDALFPRSGRSRVWAMGLRNPFRLSVRPGSGSANAADADPGTIIIGDVGWNAWEELNVASGPGANFGWPVYEGLEPMGSYAGLNIANLDAPNPLFGTAGCAQANFFFRDLIIQDTLDASPPFPNPCDPGQQVPSAVPHFVHRRPAIEWGHGAGPARVGYYIGNSAAIADLGSHQSPVAGAQFGGNSATGGVWYTGTSFPPDYQNTYFVGDYSARWLRNVVFDANDRPVEVRTFSPNDSAAFVALTMGPIDGALYYVNYIDDAGGSTVRRIMWVDNAPPTAVASAAPPYGPAPLAVQFTGSASFDVDATPGGLTYEWDFGDGSQTSVEADPAHVYPGDEDITGQGAFTGIVFTLVPPTPTGGGNWNPEIMRDGDYPPVGNQESQRQFDTYHGGQQGNEDFIGYTFAAPRTITGVIFQEGMHFFDGGWFDVLRVQYRLDGGAWGDVPNVSITPSYPGDNGVSFETLVVRFDAVATTGIRLYGEPGGSADFISVGELRVLALPQSLTGPARFDATLTVRDALNSADTTSLSVWVNNTPPVVTITSPLDGATYAPGGDSFPLALTANVSDAEHAAGSLACRWQTILHHNEHSHPEPEDLNCATTTVLTPVGCDGQTYYYEFSLLVTDPLGLSTVVSSNLYPDCPFGDFDLDLDVDSADVAVFQACFSGSGVPFAAPICALGDAEPDGDVDLADWAAFVADMTGALDIEGGGH